MLSFSVQHKIIFKTRNTTGDKQGQIIMIKESIHQEDITTINVYTHNMCNEAKKYMKQNLAKLKKEFNNYSWRFSTPLSI